MNKVMLLIASILLSSSVFAASTTGTMSANILKGLDIVQIQALNFGDVLSSNASGSVIVSPQLGGAPAYTGGASASGGTVSPGRFHVTGGSGTAYTVTLPTSTTLTCSGGTTAVDTFTHDSNGMLDGAGNSYFYVGGTMAVPADAEMTGCSANYAVTVNFQ